MTVGLSDHQQFVAARGPFFRKAIETFDDPVDPGILGIEVIAPPADHVVV